jgi:hypothetical protein
MHLFDYSHLADTQHAFYTSMLIACALTYLGATAAVFGIHRYTKARGKESARRWKQLLHQFRELFSSDEQVVLPNPSPREDYVPDWNHLKRPFDIVVPDAGHESV